MQSSIFINSNLSNVEELETFNNYLEDHRLMQKWVKEKGSFFLQVGTKEEHEFGIARKYKNRHEFLVSKSLALDVVPCKRRKCTLKPVFQNFTSDDDSELSDSSISCAEPVVLFRKRKAVNREEARGKARKAQKSNKKSNTTKRNQDLSILLAEFRQFREERLVDLEGLKYELKETRELLQNLCSIIHVPEAVKKEVELQLPIWITSHPQASRLIRQSLFLPSLPETMSRFMEYLQRRIKSAVIGRNAGIKRSLMVMKVLTLTTLDLIESLFVLSGATVLTEPFRNSFLTVEKAEGAYSCQEKQIRIFAFDRESISKLANGSLIRATFYSDENEIIGVNSSNLTKTNLLLIAKKLGIQDELTAGANKETVKNLVLQEVLHHVEHQEPSDLEVLEDIGLKNLSTLDKHSEVIISMHRTTRKIFVEYIHGIKYEAQIGTSKFSKGFEEIEHEPRAQLQKYLC